MENTHATVETITVLPAKQIRRSRATAMPGTGLTAPADVGLRTAVRRSAARGGKDSIHAAANTQAAAIEAITGCVLRGGFAGWACPGRG